jgi:tetrahydromethanopterin S-methyltransferase subunit G
MTTTPKTESGPRVLGPSEAFQELFRRIHEITERLEALEAASKAKGTK